MTEKQLNRKIDQILLNAGYTREELPRVKNNTLLHSWIKRQLVLKEVQRRMENNEVR